MDSLVTEMRAEVRGNPQPARVFAHPDELVAAVGERLGESAWMQVEQARIALFADATLDHQWVHVDAERAQQGPFGGCIAHGFLTLSLIAPTAMELLVSRVNPSSVVNYGVDDVRFVTPVRAGQRVRNRLTLKTVKARSGGRYFVTTANSIEIDGEWKQSGGMSHG